MMKDITPDFYSKVIDRALERYPDLTLDDFHSPMTCYNFHDDFELGRAALRNPANIKKFKKFLEYFRHLKCECKKPKTLYQLEIAIQKHTGIKTEGIGGLITIAALFEKFSVMKHEENTSTTFYYIDPPKQEKNEEL